MKTIIKQKNQVINLLKISLIIFCYLFNPQILKSQNEYVLKIPNFQMFNRNLYHSSFIKDGFYFNSSNLSNFTSPNRTIDFQKTDMLGNIQLSTSPSPSFNFSIEPIFTVPNFHEINIISTVKGPGLTNYFLANLDYQSISGRDSNAIVLGEMDNFGSISNLNVIHHYNSGSLKLNKMIYHNSKLYSVGLFNDGPNFNNVFVLLEINLSLNLVSAHSYITNTTGKKFVNEISEGLDLIVDNNNDICVIGNIFDPNPSVPLTNQSTIFPLPAIAAHNYSFVCKINISTFNTTQYKIIGTLAGGIYESLSFRRIMQINDLYYLFGNAEFTIGTFKPLITVLDNSLNVIKSSQYYDLQSGSESFTDVAYDNINNFLYTTTRGFVPAGFMLNANRFANRFFMKSILNKGSLYKIDPNTLNSNSKRSLDAFGVTTTVGLETVQFDETTGNLILSGSENSSGNFDKFLWYIKSNNIETESTECSSNKTYFQSTPNINAFDIQMKEIRPTFQENNISYSYTSLTDINFCGELLDVNSMKIQKQRIESTVELIEKVQNQTDKVIQNIIVYDIMGRFINKFNQITDLNALPQGLYVIQINYNNSEIQTYKVKN